MLLYESVMSFQVKLNALHANNSYFYKKRNIT